MFNPAVDVVHGKPMRVQTQLLIHCTCIILGYEPSMMICMPVKVQREDCSDPEVIAVAVACDKQKGKM